MKRHVLYGQKFLLTALALPLAQFLPCFPFTASAHAEDTYGESRRILSPTSARETYFSGMNLETISVMHEGKTAGQINVYQHIGGTFVPIGALSALLKWPITVHQDNRVAEGFSPVTNQKITIAPSIKTILIGGEAVKLSDNRILFYQNDIYVDSDVINENLGIKLTFSRNLQNVEVVYKPFAVPPAGQSTELPNTDIPETAEKEMKTGASEAEIKVEPKKEDVVAIDAESLLAPVKPDAFIEEPKAIPIQESHDLALEEKNPAPVANAIDMSFEENNDALVLQIVVNNIPMVDLLNAYEHDKKIFLPFSALSEILEFPIKTNIDNATAEGWFIRESNTFSFDGSTATVKGKSYKITDSQIIRTSEDFYFDSKLLEEWLSVSFDINVSKLQLAINSQQPFPFEERLKREQLYSVLENQKKLVEKQKNYRPYFLPYKAVSFPIVDVNLTSAYQRYADQRITNQYFVQGAGDLAFMTSKFYLSGDLSQSVLEDFRFNLGRDDYKKELLGPLKASSVRFGDINSIGISQIAQTSEGRGFTLSNRDLARSDKFDVTSFSGDSTPGWDVELYRNETLIDTQRVSDEGRYEFNDVPILFGNNVFRVLLLGPQGQQEERTKTINASDSILDQGAFTYNVSADEKSKRIVDFRDFEPAHPDGIRMATELEYGVTKWMTATLGSAKTFLRDGEHKYIAGGVRTSFLGVLTNLDHAYDTITEARSTRVTSFANFLNTNIRFTQKFAKHFVSEEDSNIDNPVERETTLDLDRSFNLPLIGEFSSGVFVQKRQYEASNSEMILRHRLTKTFRGINFTNTLEQNTYSDSEKRILGSFAFRGLVGANLLALNGDYSIRPEEQLNQIKFSWLRNFTPDISNNFSIARQYSEEAVYLFENGITFDLKKYKLSFLGRYDTTDDFYAGINLNFSFGRYPDDQWTFSSRNKSETGVVVAKSYIDNNYNLEQDENETSIESIPLKIGSRSYSTNTDGIVIAENLDLLGPTYLYADDKNFNDSALGAGVEGYEMQVRPGYQGSVMYPIFRTAEIDGYVELPPDVTFPRGTKLALVNGEGQPVSETSVEFDGYFLFRNVLPGNYSIKVPEEFLKSKNLGYDSSDKIVITNSDFFTANLKLKFLNAL